MSAEFTFSMYVRSDGSYYVWDGSAVIVNLRPLGDFERWHCSNPFTGEEQIIPVPHDGTEQGQAYASREAAKQFLSRPS